MNCRWLVAPNRRDFYYHQNSRDEETKKHGQISNNEVRWSTINLTKLFPVFYLFVSRINHEYLFIISIYIFGC